MSDLVSVVIPAYNAGEKIRPCIESLIAQDYDNIEIVIVDDSSQDNTAGLAQEILASSRIPFTLIKHERNRGECAARNTGLDAAKGDYIVFMDDDDMAGPDFMSTLHTLISRNECDISFCGMSERYGDGTPKAETPIRLDAPFVRSGEEMMWLRLTGGMIPPHMCAVMIRRKFLTENGLRWFDGSCPSGDMEFQFKVFCRAKRAAFTNKCLYIYIHHAGMFSLSGKSTPEKKLAYFDSVSEAAERYSSYILENAPSERVRMFARKILMPQQKVRRLTRLAVKNDRKTYDSLLHDAETARTLREALGFYALTKKPEVFLKAVAVMFAPGLYFAVRRVRGI